MSVCWLCLFSKCWALEVNKLCWCWCLGSVFFFRSPSENNVPTSLTLSDILNVLCFCSCCSFFMDGEYVVPWMESCPLILYTMLVFCVQCHFTFECDCIILLSSGSHLRLKVCYPLLVAHLHLCEIFFNNRKSITYPVYCLSSSFCITIYLFLLFCCISY